MLPQDVLKRPLIMTEKGNNLREQYNQYLFEVDRRANKIQIRTAVETLFDVKVETVRTVNIRGRMRRMGRGYAKTRNWKKAIVALKEGHSIDFFEGV